MKMELIDTNFNHFDGYNCHQQSLSLFSHESNNPLSLLLQKKVKIKKINFGTKIKFLKTKGTDHLLNEKNRGLK